MVNDGKGTPLERSGRVAYGHQSWGALGSDIWWWSLETVSNLFIWTAAQVRLFFGSVSWSGIDLPSPVRVYDIASKATLNQSLIQKELELMFVI